MSNARKGRMVKEPSVSPVESPGLQIVAIVAIQLHPSLNSIHHLQLY